MKAPEISKFLPSRITTSLALAMMLIFTLTAAAHAQTYTKLYDLGTNSGDPVNPAWMGLFTQGRDGNLYSTTQGGGVNAFGAVFQLTPAGTMTRLWSFDNTSNGAYPYGGLTLGTDGSLYGTTSVGGVTGFGNAFKITTAGKLKVLHNFDGSDEGTPPYVPPIEGFDGNFYGTTSDGYNSVFGTVYKLTPKGKLTVIYSFPGKSTLGYPEGLTLGTDGNFYGTALGGANRYGGVFKITPRGKLTLLHSFTSDDGQNARGAIIQASDGNFYGTTQSGGTDGLGVVYKMTPAGVYTVIHNFLETDGLGYAPFAGLTEATDGNLYGVTNGPSRGLLFQITPSGKYSVIHTFGGPDGQSPQVSLYQHTSGVIYGDTDAGGTGNMGCNTCGVLFSLDMGLGPFVRLVNWWGKTADTVEILGQGLTHTTKVTFNGTSASFQIVSDTYVTATVPPGAKTGYVTVKVKGNSLKSNHKFYVLPTIQSFSPTSGSVGTPVKIIGTSFTGAKKVSFGGVNATVFSVDSDTQITATVPTGAVTGKIKVTTPGGVATSTTDFTVTP